MLLFWLFSPYPGNEHVTEVAQRILQNTLEQLAIYLPNILILATIITEPYLFMLRYLVWTFVAGRIAFQIGYSLHPKHRAYGFGYQFVPMVLMFVHNFLVISGIIKP